LAGIAAYTFLIMSKSKAMSLNFRL